MNISDVKFYERLNGSVPVAGRGWRWGWQKQQKREGDELSEHSMSEWMDASHIHAEKESVFGLDKGRKDTVVQPVDCSPVSIKVALILNQTYRPLKVSVLRQYWNS
ncbi:hypothetical protein IAQ61_010675 [Plenodomus lingam]|nr:hypothetical protein IAQ61_010675 [Plenodomus lingam]